MITHGKPSSRGERVIDRRIRLALRWVKPCRVLVLGCGRGYEVEALEREGFDATGIDVDHYTGMMWYDGTRLPFDDGAFDAVASFQVLEHVEDERMYLSEARRVLVPEGKLVVSVPNRWWIFEMHYPFPFNRIPFLSWLPRIRMLERARIYTKQGLCFTLEWNGFDVQEMVYMTAPMDRFPLIRFPNDKTSLPFQATEIMALAGRRECLAGYSAVYDTVHGNALYNRKMQIMERRRKEEQ